jgi:hypothetical protein
MVSKALEAGDDVVNIGVGEFPQEHFGELDLARAGVITAPNAEHSGEASRTLGRLCAARNHRRRLRPGFWRRSRIHAIAQPSRTGRPDEKHKWRTVRGSGLESAIAPDPRARIWANPIVRLGAKPDKSV